MRKSTLIDGIVGLVEGFNLVWAVCGGVLNYTEGHRDGGIRDCASEYSIVISLIAFVYITIGIIQILRFGFYICVFVYHRQVFGYFERRYRNTLNAISKDKIEVKFEIKKYNSDQQNECCSICCQDFRSSDDVIHLPCKVDQHIFHTDCISEWF